jgi:hypothetical protein
MKQFRDTDYYITEDGNVHRKCKISFKKLKPSISNVGYLRIGLTINKKQSKFLIHRLVAECYISNPNNLPVVEHRDDIKTNNHVLNLFWSTTADNNKHALKSGVRKLPKGIKHYKSKLSINDVQWIRQYYIPRHTEFGSTALGKKFNVSQSLISNIVKNKRMKNI